MIRDAAACDIQRLTHIAFSAKRHWNYPEEYFEKWTEELTITEKYVEKNFVRCKEIGGAVVGFYSLIASDSDKQFGKVFIEKGLWLDHMFIEPKFHRQGIGTGFFLDIHERLVNTGHDSLKIFVDPFASEFYEKMGSRFLCMSESSIPERKIPVYEYRI